MPKRNTDMYFRYGFYGRLENMARRHESFSGASTASSGLSTSSGPPSRMASPSFLPPPHVLPSSLYVVSRAGSNQGSLATILSIVNTMMGSTLVALPWGFAQSGASLAPAEIGRAHV